VGTLRFAHPTLLNDMSVLCGGYGEAVTAAVLIELFGADHDRRAYHAIFE
jgi:hypothetical protein